MQGRQKFHSFAVIQIETLYQQMTQEAERTAADTTRAAIQDFVVLLKGRTQPLPH